jgi:hypothetical protein
MLAKGDIIQIKDKGLFYVMDTNPTRVRSFTGASIHQLQDDFIKLAVPGTQSELRVKTKISNFIKECLSL